MRLSVVVPVHNGARFLRAAIDSVLADLPLESEVVVVDDGSTDATPELLRGYRDRARVVTCPARSGAGTARNLGVSQSTGEVLAFHDADDLVLPGRFAVLLAILDDRPEIDLAFGNGIKIDERGHALGPLIPARHTRHLRRRVDLRDLLGESFIFTQASCMRRAAFLAVGGFRRERVEDWDLALRIALRSRIAFVDRALFAYRRHPASVTEHEARFSAEMVAMLDAFVADFPEVYRIAGRPCVQRAIAKRLERSARHMRRAGDREAARVALDRAISLAPGSLRYRWRRFMLAWQAIPILQR